MSPLYQLTKKGKLLMNKFLKYFSVIISVFYNLLVPHRIIFGILIVANIVDYITAILGAFSRGEKIDLNISIKGIVKKINLLILVCVSLMIDALINYYFGIENYTFITASVIIWLTMHEILSILENIGRNNDIKIPKILLDMVERLKHE